MIPAALLLLGLLPAGAAADNLLPNASLEEPGSDPSLPAHWSHSSWGGINAGFAWAQDGYEGQRSLLVQVHEGGAGDAKWLSAPVALVPGHRHYRVLDRFRADVESTLLVQVLGHRSQTSWLEVKTVPHRSSWGTAEGLITVPRWATALRVGHVIRAPGFLQTDAYQVDAIDPDDPPLPSTPPPTVSLAFDDGWRSAYFLAVPLLEEYGFRGSHFVHTDWLTSPGYAWDHLTGEELALLAQAGHEVGSHAMYHDDLPTLPPSKMQHHVVESLRVLTEDYGLAARGFVPPGGDYDETLVNLVREYYDYLRTVKPGLNVAPYDLYALRTVVVTDDMTLEDVRWWIERAAEEEAWLILLYHRFDAEPKNLMYVTPERFRETLEYLAARQADVRPIGEVLGVWSPDSYQPPTVTDSEPLVARSLPRPDFGGEGGCSPLEWRGSTRWGGAGAVMLLLGLLLAARRLRAHRR